MAFQDALKNKVVRLISSSQSPISYGVQDAVTGEVIENVYRAELVVDANEGISTLKLFRWNFDQADPVTETATTTDFTADVISVITGLSQRRKTHE